MKKVVKDHKWNQFSNQALSQKASKTVKGGNDIVIADIIMEYINN